MFKYAQNSVTIATILCLSYHVYMLPSFVLPQVFHKAFIWNKHYYFFLITPSYKKKNSYVLICHTSVVLIVFKELTG